VFLADTTGELMGLYGIADVVFVGKSVCAHGSQNMIEPCLCGKPTVVGPYTENFRPVMSDLLEAHGVIQAQDADGVEEDTVTAVFQKGYKLGDRVLRPAMVKVAN
jgi:3-deoxy-D-manno-octulosonic-acid transferase